MFKKTTYHWLLPWDIATVLQYFYFEYFRYAWPSPSSMTLPTCRKIWCLSAQKMNFFSHFFLEILQRSCKIVILGTLCTTSPPKLIKSTCRKFDFCLYAKINFTPPFFPEILQRYCKFILGHAWLRPVKTILPACRKLWCVSSCIKLNLSLASFLKYC